MSGLAVGQWSVLHREQDPLEDALDIQQPPGATDL